jgi:endonuclease/exonuclease/phosphatase family metal-dependent hydrolase
VTAIGEVRMRRLELAVVGLTLTAVLGPGTPSAAQGPTVRIAAYNIKHGLGMDDRVDLVRVANVLRALDADVITLQEVDRGTERTDRVDQPAVLAQLLGYEGFHGPHRPYQGGEYGNAVLTRLPVRASRTHTIPPASGSALAVHEVEVDVAGFGRISVVSVHLAGSVEERLAQADSVTSILGSREWPVVLAGDFNGRPEGPVVRRLSGIWSVLAKTGTPFTFPSDAPDREIDFVMARPMGSVEVVEHRVIADSTASDHRPILAVLELSRPR